VAQFSHSLLAGCW